MFNRRYHRRALAKRLLILLIVYALFAVGFLALLADLLPSPVGHPWLYVLYSAIVILLYVGLAVVTEVVRKKRI